MGRHRRDAAQELERRASAAESLVAAELITSAANNTGFWPLPDGSGAYVLQPASDEVADDAQTVLVTNWLERLATRFANQATRTR